MIHTTPLRNNLLSCFFFLSIIIMFSSCQKEDNARKKIAGTYSFYNYEVDYYNTDGVRIDSSKKWDYDGTITLTNDNQPGADWYNNCDYSLAQIPKGWYDNGIMTKHPYWHVDQGSMKVISFFIEPNPGNVQYASYTITRNGPRKYIFSYVSASGSSGKILYEERLYLKEK